MTDQVSKPDEQSGTGEPRSSSVPTGQGGRGEDSLQPPDEDEVRDAINRSGSGGSGGPAGGDLPEEGSGARTLEEMLTGDD